MGGRGRLSGPSAGVFHHWVLGSRRSRLGDHVVAGSGGPQLWVKSSVQALCHGHLVGRWSLSRRAELAIRAGTMISLHRIVAVVALASAGPVMLAAAQVKLNAMPARTSQAALALNTPAGARARSSSARRGPAR
jgi:hypothetical protein